VNDQEQEVFEKVAARATAAEREVIVLRREVSRLERAVANRPKTSIRAVIVESPFAGDVQGNLEYLFMVFSDCVLRGESPYASHAILTTCLNDLDRGHRALGLLLGEAWRPRADLTAFYTDRGWSEGMLRAKRICEQDGLPFEERQLARAGDGAA